MPIDLTSIQIDRQHSIPLSRQLYVQLHQQVLHGQIIFKERLPSTRELAAELNLSRGVVVECYDMLKADGLVAGFGKGGTQVCYRMQHRKPSSRSATSDLCVSRRGERISSARRYKDHYLPPLPLSPNVPDFSLFSLSRWQSLSRQAAKSAPAWYQRDGGVNLLKRTLQDYLAQYRGIRLNNLESLLITTGSQSALSLLARLLAEPGDSALLEYPCWSGTAAAMHQAGLIAVYAPVDDQGITLEGWRGERRNQTPRIAVITPAMQFPTGCLMSMQRREALLHYTASHRCWLIEDDYVAEYSYAQHPAPSILAHSSTDHVIHIGTLSKLLFPGMRLGWIVVPENIARNVSNALNTCGIQPPYMLQQQLGLFMQYGYLSAHLAHTRAIYNERRHRCHQYIEQHARRLLDHTASISGMNLYLKINQQNVDVMDLTNRLRKDRLGCEVYTQYVGNHKAYFLLLGHANLTDELMVEHLNSLFRCLAG